MEWQPIETYDTMKIKPKYAAFYFKREKLGRMMLQEHIEFSRHFGKRTCTHWMPLPEPPK